MTDQPRDAQQEFRRLVALHRELHHVYPWLSCPCPEAAAIRKLTKDWPPGRLLR